MTKDLKNWLVKDLILVIMSLTREFGYFCNIDFKIVIDNSITVHICPAISYKYTLEKL